jgi:hypothetical protein
MPSMREGDSLADADGGASRAPEALEGHGLSPGTVGERLLGIWAGFPRAVLRVALTMDVTLLALYVVAVAFLIKNPNAFFLLDLESEGNPPSWWYGSQQLLVALAFLLLASAVFTSCDRIRPLRPLFLVSGIGFAFVSLDEVGEVHEVGARILINVPAIGHAEQHLEYFLLHSLHQRHRLHGGGLWEIVYTVIGVALLVWLVPRVIEAYRIWPKQVARVAIGFGIFAFSAAVLQVLGWFTKQGTTVHQIYVFVEQGLKMVGITIALFGVVQVLAVGLAEITRQLTHEGVGDA